MINVAALSCLLAIVGALDGLYCSHKLITNRLWYEYVKSKQQLHYSVVDSENVCESVSLLAWLSLVIILSIRCQPCNYRFYYLYKSKYSIKKKRKKETSINAGKEIISFGL